MSPTPRWHLRPAYVVSNAEIGAGHLRHGPREAAWSLGLEYLAPNRSGKGMSRHVKAWRSGYVCAGGVFMEFWKSRGDEWTPKYDDTFSAPVRIQEAWLAPQAWQGCWRSYAVPFCKFFDVISGTWDSPEPLVLVEESMPSLFRGEFGRSQV